MHETSEPMAFPTPSGEPFVRTGNYPVIGAATAVRARQVRRPCLLLNRRFVPPHRPQPPQDAAGIRLEANSIPGWPPASSPSVSHTGGRCSYLPTPAASRSTTEPGRPLEWTTVLAPGRRPVGPRFGPAARPAACPAHRTSSRPRYSSRCCRVGSGSRAWESLRLMRREPPRRGPP